MLKAAFVFLPILISFTVQAAELIPCGLNTDFNSGKIECAKLNRSDAETNGWNLVRRTIENSWWQDSETGVVWGPTNAYWLHGKAKNGSVAFTFDAAEKACAAEGASLPALEDYIYAFTWRYANVVMNNSVESKLGPAPVFWAKSTTFKDRNWWISFDDKGNLVNRFVPLSKAYPGDFRCVWRP